MPNENKETKAKKDPKRIRISKDVVVDISDTIPGKG